MLVILCRIFYFWNINVCFREECNFKISNLCSLNSLWRLQNSLFHFTHYKNHRDGKILYYTRPQVHTHFARKSIIKVTVALSQKILDKWLRFILEWHGGDLLQFIASFTCQKFLWYKITEGFWHDTKHIPRREKYFKHVR